MKYVVKLTMDECKKLGMVTCANCGYPPNNHWDENNATVKRYGGSACAHTTCPAYKPRFRYGKEIK